MSRDQSASVGPIIATAACLGALVGILVRPVWTDNLIGAQMLAGVVEYPVESLMPLVYLRPHSVLTQIAALLLASGAKDWYVALVFSGLQGALGMAALSALTLVFCRDRLAGLFVPLVLLRLAESLPMWPGDYLRVFHGHLYPNTFPVGPGVFGVVGLFVGLLAIALMGLDRRRPAALALGLLPAIHVGMAVPFWLAVAVVKGMARWRPGWSTPAVTVDRRTAAWFAAGLVASAISVAAYLTYVPMAPPHAGDAAVVAQLLQGWDDHTRALGAWEWIGLFESELYTLLLAFVVLAWRPSEISDGARAVTRLVLVITAAGLVYTLVAQAVPALVPNVVRTALVTRWLNVSSWFFPVVALSLIWRVAFVHGRRQAVWVLLGVVVLVWGRLASGITIASGLRTMAVTTLPWDWLAGPRWLGLAFPLLVVGGAVGMWRRHDRGRRSVPGGWRLVATGLLLAGWLLPFRRAAWFGPEGNGACPQVIAEAARRTGPLLLGADLWEAEWVQVRTRRPIVFEAMDLNILPFSPSASSQVVRILDEVYGRELEEGLSGRIDRDWPGYDEARWRRIVGDFPATQVLVTSDLRLQLPLVVRDTGCALYQLPEGT